MMRRERKLNPDSARGSAHTFPNSATGEKTIAKPATVILDSISACRLLYAGAVQGESAIILLRSRLLSVAQRMGFPDGQRENMALVAAEMVSNQVKYAANKGQIQIWQQPGPVLDILALDYGPGIANLQQAQQDGFSTARTLGKGLGSIQRLADKVAIYTQTASGPHVRWNGTAVLARFRLGRENRKAEADPIEVGLFSRALSDDRYNGDRIYLKRSGETLRWLHLDGLGHGENAQSTTADLADHLLDNDPATALASVDRRLHGTRGAVAVIGEIVFPSCELQLLGVGDMHAIIHNHDQLRKVSFAPGVLGREHKSPTPFREVFERRGIVLTASDGIRRSWDEASFPGLFNQPPQLIAYVLGNIMGRISDDQSLCVVGIN
jgi:anti-sigma regulatory factor (Ser/Thr protein kinase)